MKKYFLIFICLSLLILGSCSPKEKVKYNASTSPSTSTKPSVEYGVSKEGKTTVEEGKITTKWDKGLSPEQLREKELKEQQKLKEEQLINEAIKKFTTRDIHFDFDDYKIKVEDIPFLEELAAWLKEHPEYKITIEGHCDERGSDLYNLALGQKRANATKDFLVSLGVESKRIDCISYGEERPIDPRHNEEAWAKNRRCHFDIYK